MDDDSSCIMVGELTDEEVRASPPLRLPASAPRRLRTASAPSSAPCRLRTASAPSSAPPPHRPPDRPLHHPLQEVELKREMEVLADGPLGKLKLSDATDATDQSAD